jgi:hypothetical protein
MNKKTVMLVMLIVLILTVASAIAEKGPKPVTLGPVTLERVHHDQNLLPDSTHAGFGSLLFDAGGALVMDDSGETWLYSTGLFEAPTGGQRDWYGKWVSHVRRFNPKSLVSGEKKLALGLAQGDKWAVIHHAIKVNEHLFVVFYSTNLGVRAAIAERPDVLFKADGDFQLKVTEPWEDEGGEKDSLESCGGHVAIENTADEFVFWLIYDSYHVDATRGNLGWAKVRIDKRTQRVELLEKHPANPLKVLPENYIAARAGGNVASDVLLGGLHTLFYYTRPTRNIIMLAAALSPDPLFQEVTYRVEFDQPLGDEVVIEKFEAYQLDDILHIIYENKLASGHWGTGIRLYKIVE